MSGPLVSASAAFVAKNSRKPPFAIEQSLRFNSTDSTYLYRTPSSAGNQRTWTWSVWLKRGSFGTEQNLFTPQYGGDGSNENQLQFLADDTFRIYDSGGSWLLFDTTQVFRDPSAWFHLVIAVDTTQATSTDRFKLYINGVQVTVFDQSLYPVQDRQLGWNSAVRHDIGRYAQGASKYFNGYMAEFHMVDGTALDHEDFGELDDNGVWRPIAYTGSYGTNGCYLKFDPSATNGIGHDHSGNGNNFTASGFDTINSTAATYDVMGDTPTTNWATLNPVDNFNGRWSNDPTNGNLEISIPSDSTLKRNYPGAYSTIEVPTTGKFYFEVTPSQQYTNIGVVGTDYIQTVTTGDHIGDASQDSVEYQCSTGDYRWNGSTSASGLGGFTSGNVYGVAIDLENETFRVYENGTAGSQLSISGWTGNGARVSAWVSASGSSGTITFNFGQRDFEQSVPSGFKPLNTANLPAPDIADGSEYFNTVTYSGNNDNPRDINLGADWDLIWVKNRTNGYSHNLVDRVRGTSSLYSDMTGAEGSEGQPNGYVDAYITNGIRTRSSQSSGGFYFNEASNNYVAWNWLAGGSVSADNNTDGSITSTVSANPSAGFSIVTYTGNGQSGATVGHGLGVAPKMIIVKDRDAGRDWAVYHTALGATKNLFLNLTNSAATDSGVWTNTEPTSTVFTVGTSAYTNYGNLSTGDDFVAYCFAEVEGYSKFGIYTGNGNADGPFVFCGFRPAFVLVKDTTAHNWEICDSTRDAYNVANKRLFSSVNNAESTSVNTFDFLSNGFKVRGTHGGNNTSGNTHIFAAFAENPFGGSGVSPATAR